MPRTYTNPIDIPDEVKAQVMDFGMTIVLNAAGNPSNDSFFRYVVNKYNSDGIVTQSVTNVILWSDIPGTAKTEIRDLYSLVLTHAQNNGLIGVGTDENDL